MALVLTVAATVVGAAPASAQVVTYPAGGEVWQCGETQTITWDNTQILGPTVDIDLYKAMEDQPGAGAKFESIVAVNVPNTGSFAWVVPWSILSDNDYLIRVVAHDDSAVFAFSDNYFTILQHALRVVSPNGGEEWLAGTTHTISWTSTGAAGADVRVELFKGGELNSVLSFSTPDDGSFDWTIRNEQQAAADYTVRVTSLANGQVAGETATFFSVSQAFPYDIFLSSTMATVASWPGTEIGRFTTMDPNPGDVFVYTLSFCALCDNADFRIAGNVLQNARTFFDAGEEKIISVTSTDQTGKSVTKEFAISVVNPNLAPTSISLDDTRISTNLPLGTLVGAFSTTDPNLSDPDSGESFLYELVAGVGSTDNADFVVVANQLLTNVTFLNNVTETRSIRVRTTDRGGLFIERSFTITVGVNQPPTLNLIGNQAIQEGSTLNLTLSGSDPNGDTLLFAASNLPPGATLSGNVFQWTPGYAQAGIYQNVHFEVTDGLAIDSEDITITVTDVNPVLFADTFADGSAAGDANWRKDAGAWTVNALQRYQATSASLTSLSTIRGTFLPLLSAGRIEALLAPAGGAAVPNAMTVFAYQGVGRYRYVQVVGAPGTNGVIRLGQVGTFGGDTAGIKAQTGIRVGRSNNLWIDAFPDGKVNVSFGARRPLPLTLTYKFPTAVAGRVGVGAVSSGAWFDNIRVSDPSVLAAASQDAAGTPEE